MLFEGIKILEIAFWSSSRLLQGSIPKYVLFVKQYEEFLKVTRKFEARSRILLIYIFLKTEYNSIISFLLIFCYR